MLWKKQSCTTVVYEKKHYEEHFVNFLVCNDKWAKHLFIDSAHTVPLVYLQQGYIICITMDMDRTLKMKLRSGHIFMRTNLQFNIKTYVNFKP